VVVGRCGGCVGVVGDVDCAVVGGGYAVGGWVVVDAGVVGGCDVVNYVDIAAVVVVDDVGSYAVDDDVCMSWCRHR